MQRIVETYEKGEEPPPDLKKLDDQFDVFQQSTKVHTGIDEITEDIVFAVLNSEYLKSPLCKWVREMSLIIHMIPNMLLTENEPQFDEVRTENSDGTITIEYVPNGEFKTSKKLLQIVENLRKLFLLDLYSTVVTTRAFEGLAFKAGINYNKNESTVKQELLQELEQKRNIAMQQPPQTGVAI